MIRLFYKEDPRVAARHLVSCRSVAIALAWIAATCLFPIALRFSGGFIRTVIVASLYVLVVVLTGEAVVLLPRLRSAEQHSTYIDTLKLVLPVLLWIVPAAIFFIFGGFIGLFVIGAFASAIAIHLKRIIRLGPETESPGSERLSLKFGSQYADRERRGTNLAHLTALICLAYLGIIAELGGNRKSAFACTAMSWFVLAWLLGVRRKAEQEPRAQKTFRLVSHATLAVAVTSLVLLAGKTSSGFNFSRTRASKQPENDSLDERLQSGIILFQKKKAIVPLILPPSNRGRVALMRTLPTSIKIPFSGEYWFSRWPLLRPPENSLREEGDPTTVDVTLMGFGRLIMQARQRMERPVDVGCCHSIDVTLCSRDAQPDAVIVELVIADSSRAGRSSQTLGEQSLAKPSSLVADPLRRMLLETFRFEMPPRCAIRLFDSLEVRFHLGAPRVGHSATASIDSFELRP